MKYKAILLSFSKFKNFGTFASAFLSYDAHLIVPSKRSQEQSVKKIDKTDIYWKLLIWKNDVLIEGYNVFQSSSNIMKIIRADLWDVSLKIVLREYSWKKIIKTEIALGLVARKWSVRSHTVITRETYIHITGVRLDCANTAACGHEWKGWLLDTLKIWIVLYRGPQKKLTWYTSWKLAALPYYKIF